ncbi:MAG: FAD:protein FMN transferase [Rhodobacter sp.]|nr:FAD:protein FMN transferase [Rhodobacter sp.]
MLPQAAMPATASWRGSALGAVATITLGGMGRAAAGGVFAAIESELSRLENIFSLYREASALSRLNRFAYLDAPPSELLEVLVLCHALNDASKGAFDPTVQPLWRFLTNGATDSVPDLRVARQLVGWDRVVIAESRIGFARPGMAITLNGIAQGYITDRIAALLRARGFDNVMIDIGEIAALGRNHGALWSAEIAAPDGKVARRLTLQDRCLAVSATMGTVLGGIHHIIEPRSDTLVQPRQLAAVSADSAALADGLSTGCCLLSDDEAVAAVARFPGARLETLI